MIYVEWGWIISNFGKIFDTAVVFDKVRIRELAGYLSYQLYLDDQFKVA
jgi:hypothetical protein